MENMKIICKNGVWHTPSNIGCLGVHNISRLKSIIKAFNIPSGEYNIIDLLELFKFDIIDYDGQGDDRYWVAVYQYRTNIRPADGGLKDGYCDDDENCYYSDDYFYDIDPDFKGWYYHRVIGGNKPIEFSEYMALKPIEAKSAHKRK